MAQSSKRQLDEQQEIVNVVKALTGVTVIRLAQTQEVLQTTRNLLERVNQSISRVFEIYPARGKNLLQKRIRLVQKNRPFLIKEPLHIYLSANQEHYGDLIERIGNEFITGIRGTKSDGLVIGKIGRIFVERANLPNTIHYFDLDDDMPEVRNINQIVKTVESYEKVIVYHGKNESLLHQVPIKHEVYNITPNLRVATRRYFFEPTALEVLDFLEMQISENFLHQKIVEGQVAKLSARRWNWTKQQLARSRLIAELEKDYKKYQKASVLKQQQVTISARRLADGEAIKVT